MEVIKHGRRKPFKKKLDFVCISNISNNSCLNTTCQLILFLFFLFFYYVDAILSLIGLNIGVYEHYNP